MQPLSRLLSATLCAGSLALAAAPAGAQTPPEVTLTRFADCGTSQPPIEVNQRFSDTQAFPGLKVLFTYSCYLIKHGEDYMVWDTGQPMTAGAVAPKTTLVAQLAQMQVKPEQVKFVGISHIHADHTGQVASLPDATLLIGKGDWDTLNGPPNPAANPAPFARWISGGGKFEALPGDKDVFGDGTVMVINTPGHTPGHHSLLVRLKGMGPVLLTGDLAHFHENYESNGVPSFNTDRAATLASLDRFKKLASNLKATVIMAHDARDIPKLPAFPQAAK